MHLPLERPAFWRAYFRWDIADDAAAEREIGERIFGPDDVALRQRLFPRLVPPAVFDDEDRAAARAVLGRYADISLEEGAGLQVLQNAAARRRLPPNITIALPLPKGHCWQIVFDPAPSIEHSLRRQGDDAASDIVLGWRDAHFQLPILRWSEVARIAEHLPPRERLFLHTTAWLGPEHDRGERDELGERDAVVALLRRHWIEADVLPTEAAIDALIEHLLFASEVRWRRDATRGWINDGDHSRRNPDNGEWDDATFARFDAFLSAL